MIETETHTGFLLTRSSRDRSLHTEISLWVTTDKGPARLVIEGEQPVFFVPSETKTKVEQRLAQAGIACRFKALSLQTFQHQAVTACYFRTIAQSASARKALAGLSVFEDDIRLHERYLTERFVYGGLEFVGHRRALPGYQEFRNVRARPADYTPVFTTVSLDIECSGKGELYSVGLAEAGENGRERVLMIGEPEPGAPVYIQWVEHELALLQALEAHIAEWDPDIIIGWNVINFDFRLLLQRARLHQYRLKLGRGGSPAGWRDRSGEPDQGFVTIPGRKVIDGIDSLKSATYHFDSFSLEFVSQMLLGRGKATEDVDNRLQAITHDFHHHKQKLARYNLEDCRLVLAIFDHTQLLDYLRLRSQLTGLELDRQGGSVAAFTNLYLPHLHRAGYVAPNLPSEGGLASPGGYVMDSRPGLYDNVLVMDFKSLYPSIIRTFKIDPMGLIEGLSQPDTAIPGYRGALFSRDKHFLPAIIDSLWRQRDEAKREGDAARSQALKIIMNSFYGVLGSGGCRFYDTRLASSITMRGHDIMQQTARWVEEQGYQVIYGDTDSTFILLGDTVTTGQADAVGRTLVQQINERWRALIQREYGLTSYLEMEYETLYTRFLMPTIRGAETGSKKRYAGLKHTAEGPELIFKGLETVRSDWTPLAKSFQTELYRQVFQGDDPSALIQRYIRETRAGERDKELVYRKRLRRKLKDYTRNVPPQVRAARQADEHNARLGKPLKYQNRGWISYVLTHNGPEPVEYQQTGFDYEHYIEKQLQPVAEAILPFIGLDFTEIAGDQPALF